MTGLRRNLGVVEAVALSLAIIAPTMAMSFNVTLAVGAAGRAAPLAFAIATLALVIVGLAFVFFSRRVASAGSAFAYIGATFGPRAGFLAGWALLLTYTVYGTGTSMLAGDFLGAALDDYGVHVPGLWVVVAAATILVAVALAYRDTRLATRLMLALEAASMLAIVVLGILILLAPGQELGAEPFVPDPTLGWSGIGYALVFAVLCFAGFEGAATLAEETADPRRTIPIAILGTVMIAGAFFVFASYVQVAGFGLDHLDALVGDTAPLNTLALKFGSRSFATLLDLAAAFSAFACTLGALSAAARLLFALGRAGLAPRLGSAHVVHGTPGLAVLTVGGLMLGGSVLVAPFVGLGPYYDAMATTGTLALILVYLGVSGATLVAALGDRRLLWGLCGALGVGLMLWPLYNSLVPAPAWPANLWPLAVLGYLALGAAVLLVRPTLHRSASMQVASGLWGGEPRSTSMEHDRLYDET